MSHFRLSANFTAEEVRYYETPAEYRPNVLATVALLERLRLTWGVPVRVVGIWRSASRNAQLPGAAAGSQHLDATAADVQPIGLTYAKALALVEGDMQLRQTFGQFISYRSGTHFHISLATRGKVGEILEQTSEDPAAPVYVATAPATTVRLGLGYGPTPDSGALVVALLLIAGVAILAVSEGA